MLYFDILVKRMRRHEKPCPVLIALITPFLANRLPNKLAPNVPNKMPRIPHFRYFASFSFVLLALFMNKPNSSRNLTIFIKSSISLFEITNAVVTKSRIVS